MRDAEPAPAPRRCLNCDASLHGPFCAMCGQSGDTRRLSARRIVSDTVSRLGDLDWTLVRTFAQLVRRPHVVAREYLDGRRVRYTDPLRYYLYMVALNVAVSGFVDLAVAPGAPASEGPSANGLAAAIESSFVAAQIGLAFMLSLVPVALALKLFHPRRRENATEHYAFVLYGAAQAVVGIMVAQLASLAIGGPSLGGWDGAVWLALLTGYLVLAGRHFYAESGWLGLAKTLGAYGAAALLVLLLGTVLVLAGLNG